MFLCDGLSLARQLDRRQAFSHAGALYLPPFHFFPIYIPHTRACRRAAIPPKSLIFTPPSLPGFDERLASFWFASRFTHFITAD